MARSKTVVILFLRFCFSNLVIILSVGTPGGTDRNFIRRCSAPRSNHIPLYIPFLTEKIPLPYTFSGTDQGGGCRGCPSPAHPEMTWFSNTTGILPKKKTMWFTSVEVQQETSAPPPKINPKSAPASTDKWCPFHKTSLELCILLLVNCCKQVKCSPTVFLNYNKVQNQKVFMSLSQMRLWQNRSSRCLWEVVACQQVLKTRVVRWSLSFPFSSLCSCLL